MTNVFEECGVQVFRLSYRAFAECGTKPCFQSLREAVEYVDMDGDLFGLLGDGLSVGVEWWLNNDPFPHTFSCYPRTHLDGVCVEGAPTKVEVPSGHLIVFNPKIAHELGCRRSHWLRVRGPPDIRRVVQLSPFAAPFVPSGTYVETEFPVLV
jgi:hypothetical protein